MNNQQNREELSKILGEKPNIYYSRVICSEDNPMISLKDTMKCVELLRQSAAKEAYEKGFIDGANATGEQAEEIHAIALDEAKKEAIEEAMKDVIEMINELCETTPRGMDNIIISELKRKLTTKIYGRRKL